VLFLAVWLSFAAIFVRLSRRQENAPDDQNHFKMVKMSALFCLLFAPTFALASVDWIMSIEAEWATTMFVVYCFAGFW